MSQVDKLETEQRKTISFEVPFVFSPEDKNVSIELKVPVDRKLSVEEFQEVVRSQSKAMRKLFAVKDKADGLARLFENDPDLQWKIELYFVLPELREELLAEVHKNIDAEGDGGLSKVLPFSRAHCNEAGE